jgi:hypothetical protein
VSDRLDPDAAARAAATKTASMPGHSAVPVVVDTRPYRWAIGGFGLLLVVIISIWQFATHGVAGAGVAAGKPLRLFSAPLANTNLRGAANMNPPCTVTKHDPRAMNVCLMVKRAPLVLAFFVTGASTCTKQVDVMQGLSRRYPSGAVQFAAVAVRTGRADAARAVAQHGWTIPVAYDEDGRVGEVYGVAICPLVELARKGGVVEQELVGEHWLTTSALGRQVKALLAGSR